VTWALAFVVTLALELPVYALLLRRPLGLARALAVAVALNLATHPLAWLATYRWGARFFAVEAGVWLAEALLLFALARALGRRVPLHEALLAALAANALSAGAGLLW
jgi:hypothetical protein